MPRNRREDLPKGWRQPPETTAEPVPLLRPYAPPDSAAPVPRPMADLRPRCVAAVYSGLFISANREWQTVGGTVEAMLATFDACADQVAAALAGHWT